MSNADRAAPSPRDNESTSQAPADRAARRRRRGYCVTVGLASITVAWLLHGVFSDSRARPPVASPEAPRTAAPAAAPRLAHRAATPSSPEPAPPERVELRRAPDEAPETFEAVIERLCRLSEQAAELAQEDEYEAAKEVDEGARAVLSRLMGRFADAGERALSMVLELPTTALGSEMGSELGSALGSARPPGQTVLLGVLQVVLDAELRRRHEAAERLHEPAPLAALVRATLETMPFNANTAELGDRSLHQRPYLGLEHEPQVLELLRLAGRDAFARPVATRMLLTLWANLRASGQRSSDELTRLALVLLDDADLSEAVVACRQLLEDARHRGLALAWLRERGDPELARQVASVAGRELPPAEALAVLRSLAPMLQHTRGSLLAVGVRAPELLADAYREQLAAGTQTALRREMVMGVGMLPDASGLEIAQLALDHDPSVEVRLQALFVFTIHGVAAGAEAAIHRVLDDPAVATDPEHLGAVVLALQNLEDDDLNVLARVGARLQQLPLAPRSRALLDALLARSLPGHVR